MEDLKMFMIRHNPSGEYLRDGSGRPLIGEGIKQVKRALVANTNIDRRSEYSILEVKIVVVNAEPAPPPAPKKFHHPFFTEAEVVMFHGIKFTPDMDDRRKGWPRWVAEEGRVHVWVDEDPRSNHNRATIFRRWIPGPGHKSWGRENILLDSYFNTKVKVRDFVDNLRLYFPEHFTAKE